MNKSKFDLNDWIPFLCVVLLIGVLTGLGRFFPGFLPLDATHLERADKGILKNCCERKGHQPPISTNRFQEGNVSTIGFPPYDHRFKEKVLPEGRVPCAS